MNSSPQRIGFGGAFVLVCTLTLSATPTYSPQPHPATPVSNVQRQSAAESDAVVASLRKDVLSHPDEYVSFESPAAAMRFIVEHGDAVHLETEHEAVMRGILGYWDGRTLVVVPPPADR